MSCNLYILWTSFIIIGIILLIIGFLLNYYILIMFGFMFLFYSIILIGIIFTCLLQKVKTYSELHQNLLIEIN